MATNKAKGIEKWGPLSLFLIYLFSWIGLICGFLVALFFLMEKQYFASFITFLTAITSWISLNAFVYIAKVIIEINDNTAYLKKS
jgi:hypothetical protein